MDLERRFVPDYMFRMSGSSSGTVELKLLMNVHVRFLYLHCAQATTNGTLHIASPNDEGMASPMSPAEASPDVAMEAADQDAAAAVESEAVLAAIHARADGDTVAELAAVEAEAAELEAQLAAAQAAAETSAGAEAGHFASECVMAVRTEALKIVFPFPYQQ